MNKLSEKLTDKFNGVWGWGEKNRQNLLRTEQSYFNQTYFQCKLVYHPHKLSLMKVEANISVGPNTGTPMMVNCRWMIKKQNQILQIQGMKSSCYQPCIEDIGYSICVQIEPMIEGKIYNGATIYKQTTPLELGATLQTDFTKLKNKLYHFAESVEFYVKIQGIYQNQSLYSHIQLPLQGKIKIAKEGEIDFQISVECREVSFQFWITKLSPFIEFIRKSVNAILIKFTDNLTMKIGFKENSERQIFALLLKTLSANSTLQNPIKSNTQQIEIEEKKDVYGELENQDNKNCGLQEKSITTPTNSTQSFIVLDQKNYSQEILQSKISSLTSQISKTKTQYRQLLKNHNIQINEKIKLQQQLKEKQKIIQVLSEKKEENQRMKKQMDKLGEDCRFYKNQLALTKKNLKQKLLQLKVLTEERDQIKEKLENQSLKLLQLKNNSNFSGFQLQTKIAQISTLNQQLTQQNQLLKTDVQRYQNQLKNSQKKIQSLYQQKNIPSSPSSPTTYKQQISSTSVQDCKELQQKNKIIKDLQLKIFNLEMLLKYRNGEKVNESSIGLQKIINSLTQIITDKEEQINGLKTTNKELLKKII